MIKATLQKKKMDGFVDLSVCVCVYVCIQLMNYQQCMGLAATT